MLSVNKLSFSAQTRDSEKAGRLAAICLAKANDIVRGKVLSQLPERTRDICVLSLLGEAGKHATEGRKSVGKNIKLIFRPNFLETPPREEIEQWLAKSGFNYI